MCLIRLKEQEDGWQFRIKRRPKGYTVYKVVQVLNDDFISPFYYNKIKLNEPLIATGESTGDKVEGGAIHAFSVCEVAKRYKECLEKHHSSAKFAILQCKVFVKDFVGAGLTRYFVSFDELFASAEAVAFKEVLPISVVVE